MQKIVTDRLRPEGDRDRVGVDEARRTLEVSYDMIEARLAGRTWAVGEAFSIADCAAGPGLFFASIVHPFPAGHASLAAYFERLLARPSFRRVLDEARPSFDLFPYRDTMPERFLAGELGNDRDARAKP
jgi:glutathione S-transferase